MNKKHDDKGKTLNKINKFIALLIIKSGSESWPIQIFCPTHLPNSVDNSMAKQRMFSLYTDRKKATTENGV